MATGFANAFGAIGVGLGTITGLLYGLSARYGFSSTRKCRDLKKRARIPSEP